MILAITSSSLLTFSTNKRDSYSYKPFHSFIFKIKGSIIGKHSGRKSDSVAKWINADRLMVVNLGEKTYFRNRGMRVVPTNINRAYEDGVYWRIALIVPC